MYFMLLAYLIANPLTIVKQLLRLWAVIFAVLSHEIFTTDNILVS